VNHHVVGPDLEGEHVAFLEPKRLSSSMGIVTWPFDVILALGMVHLR